MAESTFKFWRSPGKSPEATRAWVRRLAKVYGGHPKMAAWVQRNILRPAGVATRDDLGAVRAIHAWVRDNIEFRNESGEQVKTPARVLIWRFGDCDDRSGLVGAMLESLRIRYEFPLLARRSPNGLMPFHIWPRAIVKGQRIDLETCHPAARFGEHPARLMARMRGLQL